MKSQLHVVVGLICKENDQVLISKRPQRASQGGLWEFPGGKVLSKESSEQALKRELHEELGIDIRDYRRLIQFPFEYDECRISFDVWRVNTFIGEAYGREGQPVKWVSTQCLTKYDFPEANQIIIKAATLPSCYCITPDYGKRFSDLLLLIEKNLKNGIRLMQLRCHSLQRDDYIQLASKAQTLCNSYQASLLLNAPLSWVEEVPQAGIHLTKRRLLETRHRPLAADRWVAASCHSMSEVNHALNIDVDFVTLSPVCDTKSHPGASTLGWTEFSEIARKINLPVYALGGLQFDDLPMAFNSGAQGIAAIRCFE